MMEKYITDERTGIRYELVGDYYLPIDFGIKPLPKKTEQEPETTVQEDAQADRPVIGRFGRAHAANLKRTQRHVYSQLVAEGKLYTYLAQLDEQANDMLELLIQQMAEREGVTEQLKADDQMAWVRRMNSIRNRAEEIVNNNLIYV